MNRTYFLLPCLILISVATSVSPLWAQSGLTLQGRVLDVESRQPLAYVAVRFCGEMTGALTNSLGEFQLYIPPSKRGDSLCISSIGYNTGTFSIAELETERVNTFVLSSSPFFADSVLIEGDEGKLPSAKNLVKRALRRILTNYPQDTFQMTGYYRDYIRKDTGYINLFEAAINIWDPGFKEDFLEKGRGEILQTRFRDEIEVEAEAQIGYGRKQKIIPSYQLPGYGGNELSILQAHDPIRNYNIKSFSFVYRMVKDFVPFHTFELEDIVLSDDIPVFKIGFVYKKYREPRASRLRKSSGNPIKGTIWIRSDTYGIIKFNYINFFEDDLNKKRYEVTVEYQEIAGKQYLKYVSMNNHFELPDSSQTSFQVVGVRLIEGKDQISLRFNKNPNELSARKSQYFQVFYNELPFPVFRSSYQTPNSVLLKVPGIEEALLQDPFVIDSTLTKEDLERLLLVGKLRFEIEDWFVDEDGIGFGQYPTIGMYQFREFFVNDIQVGPSEKPAISLHKFQPLYQQQRHDQPHFWDQFTVMLNTPLKQ